MTVVMKPCFSFLFSMPSRQAFLIALLATSLSAVFPLSSCSKSDTENKRASTPPEEKIGDTKQTISHRYKHESEKQLEPVTAPLFNKQNVVSSARSKKAIKSVTPRLVRDLNKMGLHFGAPIFIRIFKEEKELEVRLKKDETFELFRTYQIAAISGGLGPKLKEGDRRTPEGFYFVPPSNMNPRSRFHLSFNIGYPNEYDRVHKRTGSAIMVHGGTFTIGCFPMTDPKIEEIYALADSALRNGQPFFRVHVFPFRMTSENMKRHENSKWISFWNNLKQGYDIFESTLIPPEVSVENGKYVFTLRSSITRPG